MSRLTKPLRADGIERIRIQKPDLDPVVIERGEASLFDVPPEHEGELVTESTRVLQIIGLSFKEGNKWRVSEGANTYYVAILDEAFADRVARGEEGFRANDYLHVVLRTRQWYEGSQLKAAYDVVKIIEHIRGPMRPPQLGLEGET